jgi:hypothetical protein
LFCTATSLGPPHQHTETKRPTHRNKETASTVALMHHQHKAVAICSAPTSNTAKVGTATPFPRAPPPSSEYPALSVSAWQGLENASPRSACLGPRRYVHLARHARAQVGAPGKGTHERRYVHLAKARTSAGSCTWQRHAQAQVGRPAGQQAGRQVSRESHAGGDRQASRQVKHDPSYCSLACASNGTGVW